MRHSRVRSLFVIAAVALLAATAVAPRLRADAQQEQSSAWASYPTCSLPLLQTNGLDEFTIPTRGGITQPLFFTGNIAACSLKIVPTYSTALYSVVQWDAQAVMPDPTTVALRSVYLNSSALYYSSILVQMSPPVVTRAIAHVADPPSASGAVDFRTTYLYNSVRALYAAAGDPALPVALSTYPGPTAPLPGAHPVLSTAWCGGDGALQDLRVVQSVMKTDVTMDSTRYDMVQAFRVPRRVRLHWVEVAIPRAVYGYAPGMISIFDATPGTPPLVPSNLLVTATFYPSIQAPTWASHYDFDTSLVLLPNHDYWLHLVPAHYYPLGAHALTGAEGTDFTEGVGGFWSRANFGDVWTHETGRALAFRLIGDTASVVGVDVSPPRRTLKLEASPNPARGAAVLTWSGASGTVQLEVMDARGRRVASSVRQSGPAGQWTWSLAGSGRPLAAGLYFARVTDAEGHAAVTRVAIIR